MAARAGPMDFTRIRKKAKERPAGRAAKAEAPPANAPASAQRNAASPSAPEPGVAPAPPAPPPAEAAGPGAAPPGIDAWHHGPAGLGEVPEAPPGDPVLSEVDVLEGALAARLQGLSPDDEPRFTTWRPGTSAPPVVTPLPASPAPTFAPSDFTVVRAPTTAAREAFQPPPPAPGALVPPSTVAPRGPRARPRDPLDEFFWRADEDAPAVPGFEAGVPLEPAVPGEADVREEYITFLLGTEEYAVAIERVREVLRCPPLTEVPRAPAHVRGVVSVRGEVVAVVEPRRRLGLPDAERDPERARLLVVDVGDGPVGLLVDAVSSVVRLKAGSIEPCPHGIGGPSQEFLAGIGRERERLFTVLDLGALLRRAAVRRPGEGGARAG